MLSTKYCVECEIAYSEPCFQLPNVPLTLTLTLTPTLTAIIDYATLPNPNPKHNCDTTLTLIVYIPGAAKYLTLCEAIPQP